jgi:hypothetical protein
MSEDDYAGDQDRLEHKPSAARCLTSIVSWAAGGE